MSTLGGIIGFLDTVGIYDVVLPFLLVFTLVFAVMERTRILGTDMVDGVEYPKRNLNSLVSFIVAFFVIASSQLVAAIIQISSQMVLVLILILFFLLLAGSFHKQSNEPFFFDKDNPWNKVMMAVVFIGIFLIFFNAIGWIDELSKFLSENWQKEWVSALIFIIFVIGFMYFITKEKSAETAKGDH